MGNRTGLWVERQAAGDELVFEANNALPLFWCAAFRPEDVAPFDDRARAVVEWAPPADRPEVPPPQEEPLELRTTWGAARTNLRAALHRAPERLPGLAPRFAAFVAALEAEGERFGATALALDAVEWTNFHSQPHDATGRLATMIAAWHWPGPAADLQLHELQEAEGFAVSPALRMAQAGWPAVPLTPFPPAPRDPTSRHDWVWVAALACAPIAAYVASMSLLLATGAFAVLAAIFVWSLTRRGRL